MLGFEQQMQFAGALFGIVNQAANDIMQASLAAWAPRQKPDPAKSWYKAPRATVEWTTPAATMPALPMAGWNPWMSAFSSAAMTPAASGQAWSALAQFAHTMAALQPVQNFWLSMMPGLQQQPSSAALWQGMMWPMNQFSAMMGTAPSTTYATYRSDGGHATAQILFPGDQTPSWKIKGLH